MLILDNEVFTSETNIVKKTIALWTQSHQGIWQSVKTYGNEPSRKRNSVSLEMIFKEEYLKKKGSKELQQRVPITAASEPRGHQGINKLYGALCEAVKTLTNG